MYPMKQNNKYTLYIILSGHENRVFYVKSYSLDKKENIIYHAHRNYNLPQASLFYSNMTFFYLNNEKYLP